MLCFELNRGFGGTEMPIPCKEIVREPRVITTVGGVGQWLSDDQWQQRRETLTELIFYCNLLACSDDFDDGMQRGSVRD